MIAAANNVQSSPRRPPFSAAAYRSLRRRLDRWELQHLRQHAADLADRLDAAEHALADAEDAAEFWRAQAMSVELQEGECLGLAVDGSLHVLTTLTTAAAQGAAREGRCHG